MLPNEAIFVLHLMVAGGLLLLAARVGRDAVTALVVVCTVLMNIAVAKQMDLFGLHVTGGNVLFATVFLANDVLNEHYGKSAARRVVAIAFAASLAVVLLTQFLLWYAPASTDDASPHLRYFFAVGMYPRIVAASMASYLLAQLLDTQLYHAIRRLTGPHRLLWLRSNGSTWLAQAFDTVFFTTAALAGSVLQTWGEWRDAVLFAYLVKIAAAALQTPFLYFTTSKIFKPPGSQRP